LCDNDAREATRNKRCDPSGWDRSKTRRTLGEILGRRWLRELGKKRWRKAISWAVPALMAALLADYVVLGGGNAKQIKVQPPGSRLSNNLTAFRDGDEQPPAPPKPAEWRLI
jgi:hypothetical protein